MRNLLRKIIVWALQAESATYDPSGWDKIAAAAKTK